MKEKWRFLIGQIFLFILKHFLTIKRNKIKNIRTGEKCNGAKFVGFFGFYVKIDLAQNDGNVEFARSGRKSRRHNDSIVTRVFRFKTLALAKFSNSCKVPNLKK